MLCTSYYTCGISGRSHVLHRPPCGRYVDRIIADRAAPPPATPRGARSQVKELHLTGVRRESILPFGYLTEGLNGDGDGTAGQDVRGPGGSHAAGHPGAAGGGRGLGDRAGGAVRDEPARGLQAPEGARAGGADRAGQGAAVAARPARGGPAQGGRRVGRSVPPLLGGELRPAGRVPGRAPGSRKGEGRWAEAVARSSR